MTEFIPLSAGIHFKCAFDIDSSTIPKIMTHLRQRVRAWCINKIGINDQTLHGAWFYRGNNPKVEPAQYVFDEFQIRTVSAPSSDPDEPTCWALEVVHPDSDERARRWSVEVTLRNTDVGIIRFTTVVKNWMLANYIGEYPPPPTASAPTYVRSLLTDPQLSCRKGDSVLLSQPLVVTSENCQSVYEQIISAKRQIPYVLIAFDPEKSDVLINPRRIAASLLANANVYALTSQAAVDEINYYLGDTFRCEYGSVRVYLPQIDKNSPGNAKFHRYLSASFIAQHGEDGILRFLTNGLARNGASFRLSDLTSFADIFTERRKYAIQRLAAERQEVSDEARLAWDDNQQLIRDAGTWESTAIQYEAENAELKRENAGFRQRIEEAERVRLSVTDLKSQVAGLRSMRALPSHLSDVLEAVASLFPQRLSITEEALEAARDYSREHDGYWRRPEQLSTAWEMVFGVATTLHDLVFEESSKRLEEDFDSAFSSFSLAMNEGKQTNKDARLVALRKRTHNGVEIDITPHVKYGNRKPKILRLYFAICRDSRRIVVGHFGDHLENYSTRKQ